MRKLNRKKFADMCKTATHPIRRIGDIPLVTRTAIIEVARSYATKKGKLLHEMLPLVMDIRGTSREIELTVVIEREEEIL
jgi:hypothetical protein